MKTIKWFLIMICIALLGIPAMSRAFEMHLMQALIKEACEYGSKYKGKDVFDSTVVKNACFGDYPNGEGGIIMSKYVHTAVMSAMMALQDKTLTPEEIKEVEASASFRVVVSVPEEDVTSPGDVQIILVQGTNNILPQKTELGMKYKNKLQGVIGTFRNEKVNPTANTTILVKTRNTQKKFKIDFSDIK